MVTKGRVVEEECAKHSLRTLLHSSRKASFISFFAAFVGFGFSSSGVNGSDKGLESGSESGSDNGFDDTESFVFADFFPVGFKLVASIFSGFCALASRGWESSGSSHWPGWPRWVFAWPPRLFCDHRCHHQAFLDTPPPPPPPPIPKSHGSLASKQGLPPIS